MSAPILIAGAGPTGLTAALALHRLGQAVRLVDKAPAPARQSRALAVNPRSLELLEPLGVTERLLAEGRRILRVQMHRQGRVVREISLAGLRHRFPFMLAIPQSRVEVLLEAALAARGVRVERATELVSLADPAHPRLRLRRPDGTAEEAEPLLLLAADGAHSTVRHALGLAFPGHRYEADWQLVDIRLDCGLAEDSVHVFLRPDGFLFMAALPGGIWRAMSNLRQPAAILPAGTRIGGTVWQASFRIGHRLVPRYRTGAVCLAGDAAHLHSPLGARGMNLGIEDAMVFAHLVVAGRLDEYHPRRHAVGRAVVCQIDLLTRFAAGTGFWPRLLRDTVLVPALALPAVRARVRARATGLEPGGGWD